MSEDDPMLKLTVAVLAVALAGTAGAAGWKSLKVDGSSEDAFAQSLAVFKKKMPLARRQVFGQALKDIWVQGTKAAEAEQREYTAADYYGQLDGMGYEQVVNFTDPTGKTARQRWRVASWNARASFPMPTRPVDQPAPIGPHGEQVRGIVDTGPEYQHSLRTMGQQ
jgi:hypothetical protein